MDPGSVLAKAGSHLPGTTCGESPLQSTGLSRTSRNTYFAVLGERVA